MYIHMIYDKEFIISWTIVYTFCLNCHGTCYAVRCSSSAEFSSIFQTVLLKLGTFRTRSPAHWNAMLGRVIIALVSFFRCFAPDRRATRSWPASFASVTGLSNAYRV